MRLQKFLLGIFLFYSLASSVHADSKMRLEKARLLYSSPPGYIVEKGEIAEEPSPFAKGDCFDIYPEDNRQFVGFFCGFSNMEDVLKIGVHRYTDLSEPGGADAGTGLVVGTTMMYYPMEVFTTKLGSGAGAEVDCDLGDGPVYRATSTCHVGLVDLKNGEFLYGFLALRNHVSRTNFVSYKELANMWGGFIKD